MLTQNDKHRFPLSEKLSNGKYPAFSSVGGYTIVYYTQDGGNLCADCASGENGSEAIENHEDPQWNLMCSDVYYEGPDLFCEHCNVVIESSYGDPNKLKDR